MLHFGSKPDLHTRQIVVQIKSNGTKQITISIANTSIIWSVSSAFGQWN